MTGERTIMNTLNAVVHWFTLNPFSGVSMLFGVGIVLVTLYTYLHDYRNLPDGS
jgi:hypothetical protein